LTEKKARVPGHAEKEGAPIVLRGATSIRRGGGGGDRSGGRGVAPCYCILGKREAIWCRTGVGGGERK